MIMIAMEKKNQVGLIVVIQKCQLRIFLKDYSKKSLIIGKKWIRRKKSTKDIQNLRSRVQILKSKKDLIY